MTRFLWAAFLIAHGLLHVAIYAAPSDPENAPFDPHHSWAIDRAHAASVAHGASIALAFAAAAGFCTAGWLVAIDASAWAATAAIAAGIGIALKVLWFHPWLTVGIALDLAVATAAGLGWPASL